MRRLIRCVRGGAGDRVPDVQRWRCPGCIRHRAQLSGPIRATRDQTLILNGGTATITSRNFYVFLDISLVSPVPSSRDGSRRASVEGCAGAPTPRTRPRSARARRRPVSAAPAISSPSPVETQRRWFWDVVAPGNGTYTFKGEITTTLDTDPDLSNNASQITIVVNESTGGGGGSGGGGSGGGSGGGGSVAATASAVRLLPARPKAGSTVVASVRVTKGGSPVRPSGIVCAASIGGVESEGQRDKAASGVASCLFKTPKSAKGKAMSGSISFRAGGRAFYETLLDEARLAKRVEDGGQRLARSSVHLQECLLVERGRRLGSRSHMRALRAGDRRRARPPATSRPRA